MLSDVEVNAVRACVQNLLYHKVSNFFTYPIFNLFCFESKTVYAKIFDCKLQWNLKFYNHVGSKTLCSFI